MPGAHVSAPPMASNPSSSGTAGGSTTSASASAAGAALQSMDVQFEPLEVIGKGTFGIIRKVRRKADGLFLARKELNYGRMDERDLRQLGEEVNILQNIGSNEYIVRYHERYVDKQNFMLYILMEYCAQGDLSSLINRCRRDGVHLAEDTVWSYLSQIASALGDCHTGASPSSTPTLDVGSPTPERPRQVILHRDIKPDNVFLDHDGIVKLGDFGLSKAMEMAAFTNTYVGTPYYMSPELINGQQYDVKSDIWSLGCLIYELCAWHPPFHQAQTQPELAKLIREGRIPNLPRGYSSQLTALIKSMLRQDPKLRPDTKAILAMDQVKHQLKVLEVHRYARELSKRQEALAERESAVVEREQRLRAREQRLASEKETFRQMQMQHQQSVAAHQRAASALQLHLQSHGRTPTLDELMQDVENCRLDSDAAEVPFVSEDGVMVGAVKAASATAGSRIARRPLEQRTAAPAASYHSKRLSLAAHAVALPPGSPMQLDTPMKGLPVLGEATTVRQVKTSKSLGNLGAMVAAAGVTRSLKKSDETSSTSSTATRNSRSSTEETDRRRFGRRSDSAAGAAPAPGSPSKAGRAPAMPQEGDIPPVPSIRRPAALAERADTMPLPVSAASAASAIFHAPAPTMPSAKAPGMTRTSTAPPGTLVPTPDYDAIDEAHLPSPFLRKRPSTQNFVANLLRPASPKKLAMAAAAAQAPPVPSRPTPAVARRLSAAAVGSGARTSLANKLLNARQSDVSEARRAAAMGFGTGASRRDSALSGR